MGVSDLIIEPSGVGKLSEIIDVIREDEDFRIVSHICIVDVKTAMKYHLNFKEYFDDQVKYANAIILSHLDVAEEDAILMAKEIIKEIDVPVQYMEVNEKVVYIVGKTFGPIGAFKTYHPNIIYGNMNKHDQI